MPPRTIVNPVTGEYLVVDDTGANAYAPGAESPLRLFGETLKPRETRPERSPTTVAPSRAGSGLETLAAMLMSLGDPGMATSYLKGREESREKERKRKAVIGAGGAIAKARELEAAGDFTGALRALAGGLTTAEDPDVLKSLITEGGSIRSRQRSTQGVQRALTQLSESGKSMPDDVARLFALRLAYDLEVPPDKLPAALEAFKKFAQTQWEKMDLGQKWRTWNTSDPTQFVDHLKTELTKLGTGQDTEALIRTEGGRKPTVIAETSPKVKVGPGEGVEELPGIQLPESPSSMAPAGSVVPTSGVVPTQVTPPTGTRTLIAPRPIEQQLTPAQRSLLADTPYAAARTFEELNRLGGGLTLRSLEKEEKTREDRGFATGTLAAAIKVAGGDPRKVIADQDATVLDKALKLVPTIQAGAAVDAEMTRPVGKDSSLWINKKTLQHPSPETRLGDLYKSREYVVARSENERHVLLRFPSMARAIKDIKRIAGRRPDLWFQRSGNLLYDQGRLQYLRGKWYLANQIDPDVSAMRDAYGIFGPALNRLSGDTNNTAIVERTKNEAALGLEPSSREALLQKLDTVEKFLRDTVLMTGIDYDAVAERGAPSPPKSPGIPNLQGKPTDDSPFEKLPKGGR